MGKEATDYLTVKSLAFYTHDPEFLLNCLNKTQFLPADVATEVLSVLVHLKIEDVITLAIIERLFELGAQVQEEDRIYHFLADNNLLKIAKVFLSWDSNSSNSIFFDEGQMGYTPLERAAIHKNYRMLSLFTSNHLLYVIWQYGFSSITRTTQDWLIRRIQSLGYESSEEGICHAVAILGGQAIITGHSEDFMRRMDLVSRIPLHQFRKRVLEAYDKRKNNQLLSLEDKDLLDFYAMCDGLELTQYSKKTALVNALNGGLGETLFKGPYLSGLESIELENAQGAARIGELLQSPINFKRLDKLVNYLKAIKQKLKQTNLTDQGAFIFLSGACHAFVIGYDFKIGQWILVDANHPKIMFTMSRKEDVAQALKNAYKRMENYPRIQFITSFITTQQNSGVLKPLLAPDWRIIHENAFGCTTPYHPNESARKKLAIIVGAVLGIALASLWCAALCLCPGLLPLFGVLVATPTALFIFSITTCAILGLSGYVISFGIAAIYNFFYEKTHTASLQVEDNDNEADCLTNTENQESSTQKTTYGQQGYCFFSNLSIKHQPSYIGCTEPFKSLKC